MPMPEDLAVFFDPAGFASTVVWGTTTAAGILDTPAEDILGGRGVSVEYALTLPAGALPGIARGASITVGGVAYTLRENPRPLDDGVLVRLILTKT